MEPALIALQTQHALLAHAQIIAQAALMSAEIASMVAANEDRQRRGLAQAYPEICFDHVIDKFEPVLGINAVITAFQL